jgi:hypothetical protein
VEKVHAVVEKSFFDGSKSIYFPISIKMRGYEDINAWKISDNAESPLIQIQYRDSTPDYTGVIFSKAIAPGGHKDQEWVRIGEWSTGSIQPLMSWVDVGGKQQILWFGWDGICCPQSLSLRISELNSSKGLVFQPEVTAGGQPCD